ncbi:carboxymuconolactone decarboxylase family protein [Streptomyces sp. NPDC017529]|uniref:carboxymuconolactone decarboxylase family protein n=1 Tax=Streptomyces sp. NPDC017529 TaxID=3365000 RepID=UPI003791C011
MTNVLVRRALRTSLSRVRHVSPVLPASADGLVAAVYDAAERDFGLLAPPVALHSPDPRLLAAAWMLLRETLVATGRMARADKEAVATAVSEANHCPYCSEVHGATLHGLLAGGAGNGSSPTGPGGPAVRAVGPAPPWGVPVPSAHSPEAVGVAVTFHYLNRVVNVFLGEPPVPSSAPESARRASRLVLGRLLRARAGRHHEPGRSLDLLPAAALPEDLAWAAPTPTVAGAFARAAAAIGAAADGAVPEPVRGLVHDHVDRWDGAPTGLGLTWLDEALACLPPEDRPAGRLALLTALASYRVDERTVAPLRRAGYGDRELVALVAWAAFAAARRAGSGLAPPADHAAAPSPGL